MIDCEKPGDCAYPGCDCEDDEDPFDEITVEDVKAFAERMAKLSLKPAE